MLKGLLPSNKFASAILVGALLFFGYQLGRSHLKNWAIERDAEETPGTVVDFQTYGRSSLISTFEYRVNGLPYRTTSISEWFKDCLDSRWCIGERYLVRYSRTHPEKAKVLWDKQLPREDCSRARVGRFIDKSGGETTMITRTASEQQEHNADGMGEMRLRLRWLDDCTYQLFDRTIINGPEPSFPASPQDTITVRIISLDDEGFTYEARTHSMDMPMTGRQFYDTPR